MDAVYSSSMHMILLDVDVHDSGGFSVVELRNSVRGHGLDVAVSCRISLTKEIN